MRAHDVRALDSLLHGRRRTSPACSEVSAASRLIVAATSATPKQARRPWTARTRRPPGGIVGDPRAAPSTRATVATPSTCDGTSARWSATPGRRRRRFVFASTCSQLRRMADPTVPIDETASSRPVSLYAEQKVGDREALLSGDHEAAFGSTCLRSPLCTASPTGCAFDLTVNEFTRDLWAEHQLRGLRRALLAAVRPRARRRARGRARCSAARAARSQDESSTPGDSDENYRKRDLSR